MNYIIRKKEKDDCFDVHHVTVISWNETYKGIVSDDFLCNMKLNERDIAKKIYDNYDSCDYDSLVLEVDDKIVGFANYGVGSEEDIDNCGEIYALYILKDYHGMGLGKKLVDECISKLKNIGYNKIIISCLKGNPSNDFYLHIGGVKIKTRIYTKLNLPENVYLFNI